MRARYAWVFGVVLLIQLILPSGNRVLRVFPEVPELFPLFPESAEVGLRWFPENAAQWWACGIGCTQLVLWFVGTRTALTFRNFRRSETHRGTIVAGLLLRGDVCFPEVPEIAAG